MLTQVVSQACALYGKQKKSDIMKQEIKKEIRNNPWHTTADDEIPTSLWSMEWRMAITASMQAVELLRLIFATIVSQQRFYWQYFHQFSTFYNCFIEQMNEWMNEWIINLRCWL